ncbi:hypothetical protein CSC94_22585 [Zhengella mangrovi]|uniref:Beta-lactamase-related domain-containing protein n=1 Tax=Zhengella mangrovi TaxID=1982044 RepID=A0A2G1QH45_9HYPH|nr:serine hydrolase domain-containing protein [Zhengella mangrovi]PHP64789.1 hypothetical protein CSC94_22585 [Zhengella mangrovi]
MDETITNWMERHHVPGLAACIAREDQIVWSRGYGMANLSKGIPFSPDRSLFPIASITKTITATAVMQLRDRGYFTLDDDVNRFIGINIRNPGHPDVPITFRHLLTHTSSLKDDDVLYSLYAAGDPTRSLGDVIAEYFRPGGSLWSRKIYSKQQPGTRERYSNAGFALLGHLVEQVSNKPLEDYLQQNIFSVIGMDETSFYIGKLDLEKQARAYTYAKKLRRQLVPGDGDGNLLPEGVTPKIGYNEHELYSYPTLADGMIRTSVNQLARFMIAMMNEGRFSGVQLLGKETVKEMLPKSGPGLAWFRRGPYWGHDGGDPGCTTEMQFNPRTRTGYIIFANADVDLKKMVSHIEQAAEIMA